MRSLTGAMLSALAAANVRAILLLELYFDAATTYLCDASQNFSWNGNTYLGAARVGSIEMVEEGTEIKMYGLQLSLGHIPNSMIAEALADKYQGRRCILRMACLDNNHQVIVDPLLLFVGRIDQMKIKLGTTSGITLTVENRLADWDRPRVRRFNQQDQQATNPTDQFFSFTDQMIEKSLFWGAGS